MEAMEEDVRGHMEDEVSKIRRYRLKRDAIRATNYAHGRRKSAMTQGVICSSRFRSTLGKGLLQTCSPVAISDVMRTLLHEGGGLTIRPCVLFTQVGISNDRRFLLKPYFLLLALF